MNFSNFVLHPIDDRAYWDATINAPRHAAFWAQIESLAAQIPEQTPPLGTDYSAAKRHNDRSIIDRYTAASRADITVLALRRCARGIEGGGRRFAGRLRAQGALSRNGVELALAFCSQPALVRSALRP